MKPGFSVGIETLGISGGVLGGFFSACFVLVVEREQTSTAYVI